MTKIYPKHCPGYRDLVSNDFCKARGGLARKFECSRVIELSCWKDYDRECARQTKEAANAAED